MRRRTNLIFFGSLLFFALGTTLLALHLSKVEPRDTRKWKKLLEASRPKELTEKVKQIVKQERQGGSKEIYLQGEKPRYLRIDAKSSTLYISMKEKHFSLEESFTALTAILEDEEGVRLIKATRGHLDYSNKVLEAEEVQITCANQMVAKADRLTLNFKGKEPTLTAVQFKASLTDERYLSSDRMHYSIKEEKMLLEGEPVYFFDEKREISLTAKQVEAYSPFRPGKEKIVTQGAVHIIAKTAMLKRIKDELCLY